MYYFIDGYNFLFRLSRDWRIDLRTQRQALIQAFNEKIEDLKLSITLVFDGAEMPRGDYTRGHWKNVEVVYTHEGLSADEYILHRLEEIKRLKTITVVTDDRELKDKAKALGASAIDNGDFVVLLEKRRTKRQKRTGLTRPITDSKQQIARLQKIFEERLRDDKK